MELHSVEVNRLSFSYYEQGRGPLVLCFHGFPDTADTWRGLMPRLASAGFRVVAPFMRGYAPTGIPEDGRYGVLEMAGDVLGLIRALGEETAILIGHDWGAGAVYAAAAKAPERIERMVAVAIPPPSTLRPSLRTLWGARHFMTFQFKARTLRKLRADDFAYLEEIYHRWSPGWSLPEGELDAIKQCFSQPGSLEAALSYYWGFFKDARRPEVRALSTTCLSVPALLMGGSEDGGLPTSSWKNLDRAFDDPPEVVILKGVGHFLHREAPDVFAEHVLRFLTAS